MSKNSPAEEPVLVPNTLLHKFLRSYVEGAELKVFQGGRNTLDRSEATFILFEAGAESAHGINLRVSDAGEFLASLPRAGFRFLAIKENGTLSLGRSGDSGERKQNILAVQQAKRARCPELLSSAGD